MNIFVLDLDPKKCAEYHNNSHCIKMILECKTLLDTAHGKYSYYNHPCAKWTRESINNYIWLSELAVELCYEYTKRYKKIHKYQPILENLKLYPPKNMPTIPLTVFKSIMPQDCVISKNPIVNYRKYYITHKEKLAQWKTQKPYWYKENGWEI